MLRVPHMAKHELFNYPLYWFDETGTPTRRDPPTRGRTPGCCECREYIDSKGTPYFKLKTLTGKRHTVYRHQILEALRTQELQEFLNPVPGFLSYSIDSSGTPYRISSSGAVRQLAPDIGARRERFVLYDCWGRRRTLSRYSLLRLVNVYKNH